MDDLREFRCLVVAPLSGEGGCCDIARDWLTDHGMPDDEADRWVEAYRSKALRLVQEHGWGAYQEWRCRLLGG